MCVCMKPTAVPISAVNSRKYIHSVPCLSFQDVEDTTPNRCAASFKVLVVSVLSLKGNHCCRDTGELLLFHTIHFCSIMGYTV